MLFISVDVEASGPVPGFFNLVSIGAAAVEEKAMSFSVVEGATFYAELKPVFPGFLADAMKVHGLSREHLEAEGVDPEAGMEAFRKWVVERAKGEEKEPVFVGHNAAFDWSFVNYYFQHALVDNPFDIFPLDTKSLAFGRYTLPWPKARKSVFQEMFPDLPKLDEEQRHRADYDALYQAKMLCELMNKEPGPHFAEHR